MAIPRSLGANVSPETSSSPSSDTRRASPFTVTVLINAARSRRPGARSRRVEARHPGDGPEPEVATPRRESAPDFVLRQPVGRRVSPRVAGRRIDFDDSARRAKEETAAGVLDHAPDVRARQASRDLCVGGQAACRQIVETSHGAVGSDDPESAQAIQVKADHGDGLPSIEDRLEAAVTIREQAGILEPEEQLTGGPSTIAGRETVQSDGISPSPSAAPYGVKSSDARRQRTSLTVIRQLGDQPDVASAVLEERDTTRRLAAPRARHSGRRA